MYCPECGSENSVEAINCVQCGTDLRVAKRCLEKFLISTSSEMYTTVKHKSAEKKWILFSAIGALILNWCYINVYLSILLTVYLVILLAVVSRGKLRFQEPLMVCPDCFKSKLSGAVAKNIINVEKKYVEWYYDNLYSYKSNLEYLVIVFVVMFDFFYENLKYGWRYDSLFSLQSLSLYAPCLLLMMYLVFYNKNMLTTFKALERQKLQRIQKDAVATHCCACGRFVTLEGLEYIDPDKLDSSMYEAWNMKILALFNVAFMFYALISGEQLRVVELVTALLFGLLAWRISKFSRIAMIVSLVMVIFYAWVMVKATGIVYIFNSVIFLKAVIVLTYVRGLKSYARYKNLKRDVYRKIIIDKEI